MSNVLDFWSLGRWFEPTQGYVSARWFLLIVPCACLAQFSWSNVHKTASGLLRMSTSHSGRDKVWTTDDIFITLLTHYWHVQRYQTWSPSRAALPVPGGGDISTSLDPLPGRHCLCQVVEISVHHLTPFPGGTACARWWRYQYITWSPSRETRPVPGGGDISSSRDPLPGRHCLCQVVGVSHSSWREGFGWLTHTRERATDTIKSTSLVPESVATVGSSCI